VAAPVAAEHARAAFAVYREKFEQVECLVAERAPIDLAWR
jgi:hypothetical protein